MTADLSSIRGEFATICADPPWDVGRGPEWSSNGASRPLVYPTMTLQDMAEMKIPAANDAHLYMWTINAYIEEAYALAREWGFKPSTMLYWLKQPHGIGLGGTFGLCVEPILFCRRGSLSSKRRIDRNWWGWPRGRHSAKPEEFQTIVESVSPGPYLELFGRRNRPGWTVWGNDPSLTKVPEPTLL